MVQMIKFIQDFETNFVPVITPFKQLPDHMMLVPQLSEVLEIDAKDTPNFWVFNPAVDRLVKYPVPLTNINDFSPEVIYLWARKSNLELEIETFKEDI